MRSPQKLSWWADARVRMAGLFAPRYGKHGAPDMVVAEQEIEPVPQVEHGEIGDGERFAAELHAINKQLEAERKGEIEPLPLTGELTDAEREATVAAIQSPTVEIPILDPDILIARDTQRWFDDAFDGLVEQFDDEFAGVLAKLVDDEETQAVLLRLARTHRGEDAPTIEIPVISETAEPTAEIPVVRELVMSA